MLNHARAQNQWMMCAGLDGFVQNGLRQPVWPYTHQLTNVFLLELNQQGCMVEQLNFS